ncbi:Na+/H+ antiporter NhaA [Sphingomonas sp.]|uniref:Na+/H+ antiporter NhaA n=1 Tax=Sphingomonas sp. TaxID=28214 RepID=UPI0031D3E3A8
MPPVARASAIRRFLTSQSAAGLVLMAAALIALIVANSPWGHGYESLLHSAIGPLSLSHWINDGLMAIFFLLVGLEIKREVLDGHLSRWPHRVLPGIAALAGMACPAIVYLLFNPGAAASGWAIPAATDIAFALAVIRLVGDRVPASLRIFLAALAIIDDLGAVLVIALFYTSGLSGIDLAGAALVLAVLVGLNRMRVRRLSPYLLLGFVLWVFMLRSGIHATIAGILLAFTIPMSRRPARRDEGEAVADSPLHRLEQALHGPVGFLILPLFGLANAGVPLLGLPRGAWLSPVTLGIAGGLLIGKAVGVFGAIMLAVRLGLADRPAHAGTAQLFGVALLCGIGFTMSIFITLLAFPGDTAMQAQAKLGVLAGSFVAGAAGYAVLRLAGRARPLR